MANSINNRFARRGSRCVRVTAAGPLLAAFTGTLGVAVASTLASSTIPPISQGGKIANRRGDRKTQATKENAPSALSMIWTARGGGVDDHRDDERFSKVGVSVGSHEAAKAARHEAQDYSCIVRQSFAHDLAPSLDSFEHARELSSVLSASAAPSFNALYCESLLVQAEGEADWVTLLIQNVVSKILRVIRTLGFGGEDGGGKGGQSHGSAGVSFTEAFETKYGERHPRFTEKTFKEATEQAWSRNRLCLVYIAADGKGAKERKIDDAICKALADPQVASFVDENFVMWVPGGKGRGKRGASQAAAKRVGAQSLPFLGVLHASSSTDKMTLERKLKCSTVALHHLNPLPAPGKMVSWMTKVLDLQRGALELERAEKRRLKDEDAIHNERVQGYSQSLKDDALREVREAQEEAERARIEEEERRVQETRQAKEKEDVERRSRKAGELGDEPSETAVAGLSSSLMLRLADGTRVRRRFLRTDPIGKVLDWADVQGVDLDTQRLSCSFPKASFAYPADASTSIEEAGLGKQALLFVEQKPKETGATRSGATETCTGDEGVKGRDE